MQFEWDPTKDRKNRQKHVISFAEASRVFDDPYCITFEDNRRNYHELRENTIGQIAGILIVTVSHSERAGVIRIISARPASRHERKLYHANHP